MTEYMADKVGQHFDAVVSSVTSFGMFVQLPNMVEGLIHISNLNDDFYSFNERSLTLTGRGTHKVYKVGMPIRVKLIRANVEQHQLDFEIYDPKAKKRQQLKRHFDRYNNNFNHNRNGRQNRQHHGNYRGGNYRRRKK
jgi:ribonuclease R